MLFYIEGSVRVCLTGFSILYKQSGFGLVEGEAEGTVVAAGIGEDIECTAVDALHGAGFAQGSELLRVNVHAVLPELSEQGAAAFAAIQPLDEGFALVDRDIHGCGAAFNDPYLFRNGGEWKHLVFERYENLLTVEIFFAVQIAIELKIRADCS